MKQNMKQNMKHPELVELLESFSYSLWGNFPHCYKAYNLNLSNNKGLKDLLNEAGYWNCCGRSKEIVYYHQIIAFFCLEHPVQLGELEVHHINGNTLDNSPANLMYLSPEDHKLVTKYQRKLTKLKLKHFFKLSNKLISHRTPFNRRGKPIHNWARFILSIIVLSVVKTARWVDQYHSAGSLNIKEVVAFIRRFLNRITQLSNPTQLCLQNTNQ